MQSVFCAGNPALRLIVNWIPAKVDQSLAAEQEEYLTSKVSIMKRALLLTVFTTLSFIQPALSGIVIKTTLTIGRKSNNCSGFGICSISSSSSYTEGAINGIITVDEESGSMTICVDKKDIEKVQPDKANYFDNKSTVVFAEDYSFPNEINIAAKVRNPIVIRKGEYSLTFKNGKYYIELLL